MMCEKVGSIKLQVHPLKDQSKLSFSIPGASYCWSARFWGYSFYQSEDPASRQGAPSVAWEGIADLL